MRRGLTWLLVVPLVVLGTEAAHALEYWLAAPDPQEREQLLADTGHGYLDQSPSALALCFGLIVLALLARLLETRRGGRPDRGLALVPFAVLPLIVFGFQEHLERLSHDGSIPFTLALDPMFLLGLALQLPFGYLAYIVGRALLGVADDLARALGGTPSPRLAAPPRLVLAAPAADLPRLSPLATSLAGRGPPPAR